MPDLRQQKMHGLKEGRVICGVDEVGRGPLAGPVVAAAVILPPPTHGKKEIRDSKKMTLQEREDLFPQLTQLCRFAVGEANIREIDRFNILWASMLAMTRAVQALNVAIDMALIDGNRCPQLPCPATRSSAATTGHCRSRRRRSSPRSRATVS